MRENSDRQPAVGDWYSPTRLHGSPVEYDFPGDRFIPNRSLMDLDHARTLLTKDADQEFRNPNFSDGYRKMIRENLTLDAEGRPFRMLVFRGSPKTSRKSSRLIDEMRRSDEEVLTNIKPARSFPKNESLILDAPNITDDFYRNTMDWSSGNTLAVALGPALFTWNASSKEIHKVLDVGRAQDCPTSVAWSGNGKRMAVGFLCSGVQLWDCETSKLVRTIRAHEKKVGSVAWNGHVLTSGSDDKAIINHDVRAKNSVTSYMKVHRRQICSLKWSKTGNILASGGDDSLVYIWHASQMVASSYLHCLREHTAAVKALDWCPHNKDVLASGGGVKDGTLKIWDVQKGVCINSINTRAQICGLQWNRHQKEILSGHGFGWQDDYSCENQLCLWKYPSMSKIGKSEKMQSRNLQLSQSPDGSTVVSAVGDQTLRFWEAFGQPPQPDEPTTWLDSVLSYKTSPIR